MQHEKDSQTVYRHILTNRHTQIQKPANQIRTTTGLETIHNRQEIRAVNYPRRVLPKQPRIHQALQILSNHQGTQRPARIPRDMCKPQLDHGNHSTNLTRAIISNTKADPQLYKTKYRCYPRTT